jgi:hypothetical protein
MSRLSDDEKRFLTDQISMLKGENERLTKYVEYSKGDKECMQNEIDVLKERNEALIDAAVAVLGNGLYGTDSKLGRLRTAVNALLTEDKL